MNSKFKYPIILIAILGIFYLAQAKDAKKKVAPKTKASIHWMSIEEVEEKMKTAPKKVYVDMYTDWCGWCKTMDKNTLTNPNVVAYANEHFYCIRFNAEQKKAITFKGKTYKSLPKSKTHALADEWMNGQLSYPTSIFFQEGFRDPIPVAGYLELSDMEMIFHFIAEDKQKTTSFEKYRKEFKPSWK
ncbi:MAG: thioredoxin family protein [Chitinophagaceae bacterium]|nr:thioredoxin family protein [Chitinophagaceae bacterium]